MIKFKTTVTLVLLASSMQLCASIKKERRPSQHTYGHGKDKINKVNLIRLDSNRVSINEILLFRREFRRIYQEQHKRRLMIYKSLRFQAVYNEALPLF